MLQSASLSKLLILVYLTICLDSMAQTDSASVGTEEILLSDSFKKALENAFSFDPVAAPLPKQKDLTVEQLHEWVGNPSAQDSVNYFKSFNSQKSNKFDAAYKAAKMWEKEFYLPVDLGKQDMVFDLGPMPNPNPHGFDVSKTLGEYLRPKEIRMRKLRSRAKKHLKELDTTLSFGQGDSVVDGK